MPRQAFLFIHMDNYLIKQKGDSMKILFLESHPMWIHGLPNGLKELGHTVIISGPVSRENILEMISKYEPDLILSMGWTPEHSREKQPWIRDAARSAHIPLVYWSTEDPLHTKNFTLPLICTMQPDFVFTVTPSLCETYEKLGIKASHLDFGYHSNVHYHTEPYSKYRANIAVVANAYPEFIKQNPDVFRSESFKNLIMPLIENNIRVDFWGNHWDKLGEQLGVPIPSDWIHGYLSYTKARKVYSSSKIVIGLQNCTDQLSQRTFEVLGSGGCLLTSDTEAVREKFSPGRDLIVSSSPEETIEKVKYYLKNTKQRETIKNNGMKAIKPHSYYYRAKEMIKVLVNRGIISSKIANGDKGELINYKEVLEKKYNIHHVNLGDTLGQISVRYDIPLKKIMKINKFTSDKIYAGQIIKISKK
jgi:spore maturation protein CgeB